MSRYPLDLCHETWDSIHLTMTSLIGLQPWDEDSRCAPIPWGGVYAEAQSRPLVVGVLWDDGHLVL